MIKALDLQDSNILASARLFASRFGLIKSLRSHLKRGKIAEVGVAFGDFTKFLLETLEPERLDAYDIFTLTDRDQMNGMSCAEILQGKTHLDFFNGRFAPLVEARVLRAIPGDSSTNLKAADVAYDMIYIDGDHSYEGVKKDAEVAAVSLAEGGLLIFNDYTMMDPHTKYPYGVVHVVNDMCVNHNWKISAFAFQRSMFCDIVLVRGETGT